MVLNEAPLTQEDLINIRNNFLSAEGNQKNILQKSLEIVFTTKNGTRPGTLLNFVSDAQKWNYEILKLLLDCGANPRGVEDGSRQTALHRAVSHGCYCNSCNDKAANCVKILLEKSDNPKEFVDQQDMDGDTALHFAARNLFPKPAAVMLDFDADIFVQNLAQSQSKPQEHVITTIVQAIPSVLLVRLDRAVGEVEVPAPSVLYQNFMSNNSNISLQNQVRKTGGYNSSNMTLAIDLSFLTQKKLIKDPDEQYSEGLFERGKESDFLSIILKAHKSAREKLFLHPVTEAFLEKKWKSVRWYFIASRTFFFIFACFFTDFSFIYYLQNCPYRYNYDDEDSAVNSTTIRTTTVPNSEKNKCQSWWNTRLYGWLLMGFAGTMVFNQGMTMFSQRSDYLNHKSWAVCWWLLIFGIGCSSISPLNSWYPANWMHTLDAFTVFWFWTMILATYTRIPRVALYVQMLVKVIKTVLFCVWVYGAIVLGFGFGFHVMFPENQEFKSPVLSFVKLLLMMLGDADYEGLLQDNKKDDASFTIPAHLFYSGFLILVTIVFMNLLVGLSVSDIQQMKASSKMAGIAGQVTAIDTLESQIFSAPMERMYTFCGLQKLLYFIQDIFSVVTPDNKYLRFQPYNPKDTIIEKKLQFKLLNLYKSTFHRDSRHNPGHVFASPKITHELLDDRLEEVFRD